MRTKFGFLVLVFAALFGAAGCTQVSQVPSLPEGNEVTRVGNPASGDQPSNRRAQATYSMANWNSVSAVVAKWDGSSDAEKPYEILGLLSNGELKPAATEQGTLKVKNPNHLIGLKGGVLLNAQFASKDENREGVYFLTSSGRLTALGSHCSQDKAILFEQFRFQAETETIYFQNGCQFDPKTNQVGLFQTSIQDFEIVGGSRNFLFVNPKSSSFTQVLKLGTNLRMNLNRFDGNFYFNQSLYTESPWRGYPYAYALNESELVSASWAADFNKMTVRTGEFTEYLLWGGRGPTQAPLILEGGVAGLDAGLISNLLYKGFVNAPARFVYLDEAGTRVHRTLIRSVKLETSLRLHGTKDFFALQEPRRVIWFPQNFQEGEEQVLFENENVMEIHVDREFLFYRVEDLNGALKAGVFNMKSKTDHPLNAKDVFAQRIAVIFSQQ